MVTAPQDKTTDLIRKLISDRDAKVACAHLWVGVATVSNCYHLMRCTRCGETWCRDSSD